MTTGPVGGPPRWSTGISFVSDPMTEDMALVGFDDVPIARYLTPRLTTVRVEIAELGRRAVESLVSSLTGGGESKKIEVIPTTLVVRESCGARLAESRPVPRQTTKAQ